MLLKQNTRKKMPSDFTPSSVVKKRPAWMTPDFNPQIADKKEGFTPYAVIPMLRNYLRK